MHEEFYQIIATVVPLLVIAMSLQSSFFIGNNKYTKSENVQLVLHMLSVVTMLVLLGFIELFALVTIYTGKNFAHQAGLTGYLMGLAFLFIILDYALALAGKSKYIGYFLYLIVLSAATSFITVRFFG